MEPDEVFWDEDGDEVQVFYDGFPDDDEADWRDDLDETLHDAGAR